jgi:hypothetical protein
VELDDNETVSMMCVEDADGMLRRSGLRGCVISSSEDDVVTLEQWDMRGESLCKRSEDSSRHEM